MVNSTHISYNKILDPDKSKQYVIIGRSQEAVDKKELQVVSPFTNLPMGHTFVSGQWPRCKKQQKQQFADAFTLLGKLETKPLLGFQADIFTVLSLFCYTSDTALAFAKQVGQKKPTSSLSWFCCKKVFVVVVRICQRMKAKYNFYHPILVTIPWYYWRKHVNHFHCSISICV